jgi:hypothetical protein
MNYAKRVLKQTLMILADEEARRRATAESALATAARHEKEVTSASATDEDVAKLQSEVFRLREMAAAAHADADELRIRARALMTGETKKPPAAAVEPKYKYEDVVYSVRHAAEKAAMPAIFEKLDGLKDDSPENRHALEQEITSRAWPQIVAAEVTAALQVLQKLPK